MKIDPHYKQGFEQGYWLRRGDSPHLKELLEKNADGNNYHKGLTAGDKEARREAVRDRRDKSNDQPQIGKDNGVEPD